MTFKRYLQLFIGISLFAGLFAACDEMDDTYSGFVKGGEIIYLGRVDSVTAYPGLYRIKLSWLLTTDPKITKCRVFWNFGADSVEVPVVRTSETDTVSIIINDLAESVHTFDLRTYDDNGHSSIAVDAVGTVYGDNYTKSLTSRPLKGITSDGDDFLLTWFGAGSTTIGMELNYLNKDEELEHIIVSTDENPTRLVDALSESTMEYRTLFLPEEEAIDTFYSEWETVELPAAVNTVNYALNKETSTSSSHSERAVDGDLSNPWQPSGSDRADDMNVWVSVDLGEVYKISRMHATWNRTSNIGIYQLLYSSDGENWDVAIEKSDGFNTDEEISFPKVSARYVKLNIDLSQDLNLQLFEWEIY